MKKFFDFSLICFKAFFNPSKNFFENFLKFLQASIINFEMKCSYFFKLEQILSFFQITLIFLATIFMFQISYWKYVYEHYKSLQKWIFFLIIESFKFSYASSSLTFFEQSKIQNPFNETQLQFGIAEAESL